MGERKTFLLRMEAEDLEALRCWAEDEFRSLNGQMEFVLRQALIRHRRLDVRRPGSPPAPADSGPLR
jgi:hypothetical protein